MSLKNVFSLLASRIRHGNIFDTVKQLTKKSCTRRENATNSKCVSILERCNDFYDAFDESIRLIELDPYSTQGYSLCCKLLSDHAFKDASARLRVLEYHIQTLSISNKRQLTKVEDIKKIVASVNLKASRNYIGRLPTEILIMIFEEYLGREGRIQGSTKELRPDKNLMFDEVRKIEERQMLLCLVCPRWSRIIHGNPLFWRSFLLHESSSEEMIDAWLSRSGGLFSRLYIADDYAHRLDSRLAKDTHQEFWNFIKDLQLVYEGDAEEFSEVFPPGVINKLSPVHLSIFMDECENRYFWDGSELINTSNMRSLYIEAYNSLIPTKLLESCASLTSLELKLENILLSNHGILGVLRNNPRLERLTLHGLSHHSFGDPLLSDHVELRHLRELNLFMTEEHALEEFFDRTHFPVLESLSLCGADSRNLEYLSDNKECLLKGLKVLSFNRCGKLYAETTIDLLSKSENIRSFSMFHCIFDEKFGENIIINALRMGKGWDGKERPKALCPYLQYLDLTWCFNLSTGTIMQLVEDRLHPPQGQLDKKDKDTPFPLPIKELTLSICDTYSSHWLRENVPRVNYYGNLSERKSYIHYPLVSSEISIHNN